jgi:hypothetical protein
METAQNPKAEYQPYFNMWHSHWKESEHSFRKRLLLRELISLSGKIL